ncbi:COP9 signalosome complex subunit 3 [Entomophthora muscae]|uniref:COP9 signalosome complex subunit 3 n=1 Tax=Entomophthora muscae TaxID=34485 RepID=A0ACC2TSX0_9FUNG|nr:COP9 signalosome complex subunit 3 [Entomophthora muscae]
MEKSAEASKVKTLIDLSIKISDKLSYRNHASFIGCFLSYHEESKNVASAWQDILPLLHRFASGFHPSGGYEFLKKMQRVALSIDRIVMNRGKPEQINLMQSTRLLCLFLSRGNFGHRLTKIHPLALKHAMLAKMYRHALPFVELDPITVVLGYPLELSDYILYYYYSGLVYLNLSQLFKASVAFEQVLVVPDKTSNGRPSMFQVEAYYKYVLIGLYLKGKEPSMPSSACKHITLCTKRFDEITSAYAEGNLLKFQAAITGDGVFGQAVNVGLAKRCIRSRVNQIIEKLPNFYMKLSLNDIRDNLKGLKYSSIENIILDLVERKKITAEIVDYTEKGKGMVHLFDAPLEFMPEDEVAAFHQLHKAIEEVDELAELSKALSHEIIVEYGTEAKAASKVA